MQFCVVEALMKRFRLIAMCFLFAGLGLGWLYAQAPAQTPAKVPTGILKMDPAMDELIDTNAQVEPVIKDFFYFTEGIVWVPQGKDSGNWLFAEMAANKVLKLTMDGKLSLYLDNCGYTGWDTWRHGFTQTNGKPPTDPDYKRFNLPGCNGLARDSEGRLVIATWGGRGLDRIEKNGKRVQLTDSVDGKKFNSTNDVVVKKDGAIYFTDGPGCGGLRLQCNDPEKGIDYNGVFMWKNGKTTTTAKVDGANGLALSPDEKYLYANGNRLVRKFKVQPDDSVDVPNMEVIMDKTKDPLPGITDGMKVDSKGNIWESCCGGIVVLTPEGKQLGIVYTPEAVANLNFGDPDYKSLYIVARTSIYKIRTKVPGIPGR
jgi:gluconolactonase